VTAGKAANSAKLLFPYSFTATSNFNLSKNEDKEIKCSSSHSSQLSHHWLGDMSTRDAKDHPQHTLPEH